MNGQEKTAIHNQIIDIFITNEVAHDDAFHVIIGLFINFCDEGNYDENKFCILVDELKLLYKNWTKDRGGNG